MRRINGWIFLGGVALAIFLLLGALLSVVLFAKQGEAALPTAQILVIPAPSSTPVGNSPLFLTPTPITALNPGDGIVVGGYVQITGTDGAGLRLREGPGTSSKFLFLGMDSEVFQVMDGPQNADGYLWWRLVAPYDENRSGWAAADYLKVVTEQP